MTAIPKDTDLARVLVTIAHLGHYHAARFTAASKRLTDLHVLSITGEPEFREFSAADQGYGFHQDTLFASRDAYKSAVSGGTIRSQLQKHLNELNPDVIAVSGWARPESHAAILWARARNRGVVLLSESQESDATRSAIREAIKARIVCLCDSAFVGGHTHAAYIRKLGLAQNVIFRGYDTVDNDYFATRSDAARRCVGEAQLSLSLPVRYILASARFIKKKNLKTLIYSFSLARTRGRFDDHLVILGDGPERKRLEDFVAELGLVGIVHMPGFRSYKTLPTYYAMASLFIHLSTSEQWGLVVNEAMACGCPVVVSNRCGSASELVSQGANGLIVDPNEPDEIAASLCEILGNEERRKTMGRQSRMLIADWGPKRFAEGFYLAVESALHSQNRAVTLIDRTLLKLLTRYRIERVA
jgi:1,2-diacylglycerol 3-alpha-glucosyltransferase